ncbi:MAG: phosphatidate cytidylyltransferase [Oscillospiraceae bacterium]|nr:phosphatidate cytidylyltransferase [Oscillospiraceae bacterium]
MKERLISSAVGLLVLAAVLLLSDTFVLPLILGFIIAVILFELSRAVGGDQFRLALIGTLLYGFVQPFLVFFARLDIPALRVVSALLLPICSICLFLEFLWHHGKYKIEQLAMMGAAMYFVTWSLTQLIILKQSSETHGLLYLILGLGGAWIADSGAYFSGVFLGKRKLCPEISPKKTVEGFVGGLISNAVVFALIFVVYTYFDARVHMPGVPLTSLVNIPKAALLGLVCAPISVVGDLVFSVIKREKGIKDYGRIMPGHGGLTDRFDSVLFVVPAFSICISLFPVLNY